MPIAVLTARESGHALTARHRFQNTVCAPPQGRSAAHSQQQPTLHQCECGTHSRYAAKLGMLLQTMLETATRQVIANHPVARRERSRYQAITFAKERAIPEGGGGRGKKGGRGREGRKGARERMSYPMV
eukprot:2788336-Pleurochrysis_carterae.AAC.1